MSLNTDNPHATITQPPRGKDMMSLALPHCVSKLPASGIDEDATPSMMSHALPHCVSELPASEIDEDATPSMMSHALPHCVSELPASGIDEDATLSREQGLTVTHSPSDTMGVAVAMDDEPKEFDTTIRAQASCTVARQSRKRKPDQGGSDKENKSPIRHPAAKRICREKTGTEWQTVLDIDKFGEEQRERSSFGENEGLYGRFR
ncbi:hypothetical protein P692DRAFT_201805436 [Suillus brevipes Sb2]|nr:hypothetical protein P692DRAFT_201805436 [Suillus brevipes Sb2]